MVKLRLTAVACLCISDSFIHHTHAYPIPSENATLQRRVLGTVIASNIIAGTFIPFFTRLGQKAGSKKKSENDKKDSKNLKPSSAKKSAKSKSSDKESAKSKSTDPESANTKSVSFGSDSSQLKKSKSTDSQAAEIKKRSSSSSVRAESDSSSESVNARSLVKTRSGTSSSLNAHQVTPFDVNKIGPRKFRTRGLMKPSLRRFRKSSGSSISGGSSNSDVSSSKSRNARLGIFTSVVAGTAALSFASGYTDVKFPDKSAEEKENPKSKEADAEADADADDDADADADADLKDSKTVDKKADAESDADDSVDEKDADLKKKGKD